MKLTAFIEAAIATNLYSSRNLQRRRKCEGTGCEARKNSLNKKRYEHNSRNIMKNRTAKALAGTPYIITPYAFPALVALVDYAAKNPGLDYGNYGEPKSYNAESRDIRKDWVRVCEAIQEAARAGVGDKDVIEAAPGAFSGRLVWEPFSIDEHGECPAHWEYCTGQYWPTEYRKAVASVIERATHSLLQSKPVEPLPDREYSIEEMKSIAKTLGSYFFSNARRGERMKKLSGNRIRVTNPGVYSNGGDHVAVFQFNPSTGSFNVVRHPVVESGTVISP